jgi:hypothetical protein
MTAQRQLLYAYAEGGGGGLGHLLLPWARAEIFRRQWDAQMLTPCWGRLLARIPPLLAPSTGRNGTGYTGSFNKEGYVRGAARFRVLVTARRMAEDQFDAETSAGADAAGHGDGRARLVVFSGTGPMFAPLLEHREMLRRRLMEMLSGRIRRLLAATQRRDFVVAAHVRRRGRERLLRFGEPQTDAGQAISERWFVRTIQNLRKLLGFAAPVWVFTDAVRPAAELRALLAMPNVLPAPRNPAVVDLLAMSRSRVLLGSARSTFSMWASFLGQVPTLWYPGGAPGLSADQPQMESETDLEGHLAPEFGGVIESLSLALNP